MCQMYFDPLLCTYRVQVHTIPYRDILRCSMIHFVAVPCKDNYSLVKIKFKMGFYHSVQGLWDLVARNPLCFANKIVIIYV
jgi:hypothetical protein